MKFRPKFLLTFFLIFILFYFRLSFQKLELGFSMMLQSHCHTSVTSEDMVTVTVTQSYGHIEHGERFKK